MQLIEKLRAAPPAETPESQLWQDVKDAIIRELAAAPAGNIETLLALPTIGKTINPATEHMPYDWYIELSESPDWQRWQRLLTLADINPLAKNGSYSPITLQHVYHLFMFEKVLSRRLADSRHIVEIGGGFGNLCRLVSQDGFSAGYSIYDTPFMSAIQWEYLRRFPKTWHSLVSSIDLSFANAERQRPLEKETTLIATWSISEMPMRLRERIFPRFLDSCGRFLIAYPPTSFEGIDNEAYFASVRAMRNDIRWIVTRNAPCTSNYMIGEKA